MRQFDKEQNIAEKEQRMEHDKSVVELTDAELSHINGGNFLGDLAQVGYNMLGKYVVGTPASSGTSSGFGNPNASYSFAKGVTIPTYSSSTSTTPTGTTSTPTGTGTTHPVGTTGTTSPVGSTPGVTAGPGVPTTGVGNGSDWLSSMTGIDPSLTPTGDFQATTNANSFNATPIDANTQSFTPIVGIN